ncbi:MAG: prepilin-type N-terminal cleavage/methylation domain-containing protein [Candidatus Omnitrophica bacterium]|nr:prepilin-type N-terminal cleavage/methylation domain-containing protein [Candidatus Omnitrophota bacterium]
MRKTKKGFSLPELIVAAFILSLVFTGVILSYIKCLYLNEISYNQTVSMGEVKSSMENIKNTVFKQISATYDLTPFNAANLKGKGVSYVTNVNPRWLRGTVSYFL